MPQINKIDHIAIATTNLKDSLAFFEGQLGIKCKDIEELPDRGIRVAILPIGDTRIELIEPMHEQSEISAFLQKRGPGLHHLAFKTADMQADIESLKKNSVKLTSDEAKPGAGGHLVAFVHPKSSGGVLVELCGPGGEVSSSF